MQSLLNSYKTILNKNWQNFEHSFIKCKKDYEKIEQDYNLTYQNNLIPFAQAYSNILGEKQKTNNIEAWDFSIFDILKFNRPEEQLHSPFVAHLLNPHGAHGQKDLFYRLFIQEIIGINKAESFYLNDYLKYYLIEEEYIYNADTSKGEIDIVIKSTQTTKPFAVLIENKWMSTDSCENQLWKYYKNYTNPNGKAYNDNNLLVIYLTRNGKNPDWVTNDDFKAFLKNNTGKNFFAISYKYHIVNWLQKCKEACESEKIKYIIEQYIYLLQWQQ